MTSRDEYEYSYLSPASGPQSGATGISQHQPLPLPTPPQGCNYSQDPPTQGVDSNPAAAVSLAVPRTAANIGYYNNNTGSNTNGKDANKRPLPGTVPNLSFLSHTTGSSTDLTNSSNAQVAPATKQQPFSYRAGFSVSSASSCSSSISSSSAPVSTSTSSSALPYPMQPPLSTQQLLHSMDSSNNPLQHMIPGEVATSDNSTGLSCTIPGMSSGMHSAIPTGLSTGMSTGMSTKGLSGGGLSTGIPTGISTRVSSSGLHTGLPPGMHTGMPSNTPMSHSTHSRPPSRISLGHHRRASSSTSGIEKTMSNMSYGHRRKRSLKFSSDQDRMIMTYRRQGKSWAEVARLSGIENEVSVKNRYRLLNRKEEEERVFAMRMSTSEQQLSSISELSSWTPEDVEYLKSLLEPGEKAKWRFISAEMQNRHNKKVQAFACQRKFKEMFGIAESSSLLGSSLSYAVYPGGWACLNDYPSQSSGMDYMNEESM